MARVTVEDCLEKVDNRFALIHVAAKRVRQLRKGAEPTIVSKNRDVVISLREVAAGPLIVVETVEEDHSIENQVDIPPEEPEGESEEAASKNKKDEETGVPEGS
jgi:DNA-directed RNA polymerase subunit omega